MTIQEGYILNYEKDKSKILLNAGVVEVVVGATRIQKF